MKNVFRHLGGGLYVDVGAAHPFHLSNTAPGASEGFLKKLRGL